MTDDVTSKVSLEYSDGGDNMTTYYFKIDICLLDVSNLIIYEHPY